ncbi:MAG: TIGR02186 family protein [Hyphomicrobiaceae bacterium]|nr:TIGR02186 family protein [Hyphomicrobiaceae bacterium]
MAMMIGIEIAEAQRRQRSAQPGPARDGAGSPAAPVEQIQRTQPPQPVPAAAVPRETVQADVSSRSVAVTSSFTGTEIVVFGAVDHSRQPTAEAGLYDIVIVLEGTPTRLVARRKSNVAGIWINTHSITFESVPSYYTILSTRPLDEVTNPLVLRENDIGFDYVRMTPIQGWETGVTTADLQEFAEAVVRLKQRDGLFVQEEYGVVFIGRSLFRASVNLPANVPVGPLDVRVYLFRDGNILSTYTARVRLEREGLELLLHNFAFNRPLLYGLFTVTIAVGAGLAASAAFRRNAR